jgi:hypothetical protein
MHRYGLMPDQALMQEAATKINIGLGTEKDIVLSRTQQGDKGILSAVGQQQERHLELLTLISAASIHISALGLMSCPHTTPLSYSRISMTGCSFCFALTSISNAAYCCCFSFRYSRTAFLYRL